MNAKVGIDYLTFSVKNYTDPRAAIRDFLDIDPDLFSDPGYGLLGYKKSLFFGGIYAFYDGDNGSDQRENTMAGCCLSLSGDGCRCYDEFSHHTERWIDLFKSIVENPSVNVTRIDVACDDFNGYLDMDTVIEYIDSGRLRSRLRERSVVKSYHRDQTAGATVYIGAASSDTRVRIYDKKAESELTDIPSWIRCEIVLRHAQAMAFVALATEYSVGELAAKVLNDKLSFIEYTDTNISRCDRAAWWVYFVDDLEKVHLVTAYKVRPTVERTADWFRSQIAPSFSVLYDTLGWDIVHDLLMSGRDRRTDDQSALVREYRAYKSALQKGA